jgi:hypothetical protein
MGLAMECTRLRNFMSQHVKRVAMTSSHPIVTPRYPWGVKNKSLMRSVPDPSSSCEGAGTQTNAQGSISDINCGPETCQCGPELTFPVSCLCLQVQIICQVRSCAKRC